MFGSHVEEVMCVDPDCEVVSYVRIHSASMHEPAWPESDTCECGEDLDWETAEGVDEEDLRWADHPDV